MTKTKINLDTQLTHKVIIFSQGGGRFGNQLINYAHFLAFLFDNPGYNFINVAFWNYNCLLKQHQSNPLCSYPEDYSPPKLLFFLVKLSNLLSTQYFDRAKVYFLIIYTNFLKLFNQSISLVLGKERKNNYLYGIRIEKINLDENDKYFNNLVSDYQQIVVSGWGFRCWKLVEKHQQKIREYLSFNDKNYNFSVDFVSKIRKKNSFLIGVFIRQSDYKVYKNGQYFFDSSSYAIWIDELKDLYKTYQEVKFLITSDTLQDHPRFYMNDVYTATGTFGGSGHYIDSMIQLSMCDLIVSPPSTFSLWSAFYGNVKYLPLLSRTQKLREEDIYSNNFFDALNIADVFNL